MFEYLYLLSVNHLCACLVQTLSLAAVNLCDDALPLHQHQFLSEALQWRAQTDPDHILYVLLNAKVD